MTGTLNPVRLTALLHHALEKLERPILNKYIPMVNKEASTTNKANTTDRENCNTHNIADKYSISIIPLCIEVAANQITM